MDRWDDLARCFERAIDRGDLREAARLLAEFTLTAPAASVRRHHAELLKASEACGDARTREGLVSTLELLRQRASLTASSLSLVEPDRSGKTRQELYRQAGRLGIRGRSRMSKEQLEHEVARKH
jgi:hypothetical protein